MTKARSVFDNLLNIYFVLTAFLFCNDIFVVFTYGSTTFYIGPFFELPLIIYLFIEAKRRGVSFYRKLPLPYYLFVATALLSFIPGFLYFPNGQGIIPMLKGAVSYFLFYFSPMALGIMTPKDKKKYLFAGLLLGFIVNIFMSIIAAFFYYVFGYVLTLNRLFVQSSFWAPNYFFGAQGLFREPAHFSAFILIIFYALYWHYKTPKIRVFLLIMVWTGFLLYAGGNFVVFIASQVVFFFLLYGKTAIAFFKNKILPSKKRLLLTVGLVAASMAGIIFLFVGPLRSKITSLFYEANPFGSANTERFASMSVGVDVAIHAPWGVGFNLSGHWISLHYSDILKTATTHNYLLQVLNEQGVLGLLFFMVFYVAVAAKLCRTSRRGIILAFSLLIMISIWFLNGTNFSYCYLITGIAVAEAKIPLVLKFWDKSSVREAIVRDITTSFHI